WAFRGRFVACVRRGHFRADFFAPGDKFRVQLFDLIRILFCKIVRLADVVVEVVELLLTVFEEFDELPIAGADRTSGLSAPFAGTEAKITGEVPVDRISV